MEHIYQVGKHKMLNRQEIDKNSLDFERQSDKCTFKPQISETSKQLSMKRSFSKEEKPWLATRNAPDSRQIRNSVSQNQLAERMQQSIQKDI